MDSPASLAYVFWHWPRSDVEIAAYEAALHTFQQTLQAHAPPGYRRAAVFRHAAAPWLTGPGPHYVDWYAIDGSAALDPLDAAAVSAACAGAHDAAAARAAGGTAGLYRLRQGSITAADVRHATWFAKPEGMSYEALDAYIAGRIHERRAQLWSRRMTLGPAPEMCLLTASTLALPEVGETVEVSMQPIWPGHAAGVRRGNVTQVMP